MIIPVDGNLKSNKNILLRLYAKMNSIFRKSKPLYKQTPIIINNYNRLTYLLKLIDWLESAEMNKIFIIDNNSSYKPLLDYYRQCSYIVFRLDKNVGHEALWRTHLNMLFCNGYYIYTDPDVLPIEECPKDFIFYFYEILQKYPSIDKVGFALKIDDIPDYYPKKSKVIEWEQKYWTETLETNVYLADIDTTFALYRPKTLFQAWGRSVRVGYPYVCRHLPWYEDPNNLDQEQQYFLSTTTNFSSWYEKNLRY